MIADETNINTLHKTLIGRYKKEEILNVYTLICGIILSIYILTSFRSSTYDSSVLLWIGIFAFILIYLGYSTYHYDIDGAIERYRKHIGSQEIN